MSLVGTILKIHLNVIQCVAMIIKGLWSSKRKWREGQQEDDVPLAEFKSLIVGFIMLQRKFGLIVRLLNIVEHV